VSDTPYLDQLIGSSASNEETDRKQIGAPTTVVAPQAAPTFPEDFEAVEADEAYPILGNVTGIGAEIGTGLYLTKRLHRSQQFLKWARGAKAASAAAIVTPEPVSTAAGLGTFALSEAAIWGVSNLIGQGIRKSFGVQDNISAGEVLASSVFGVGLVTKGGQKLISLGDGLAQMKAWGKGNELFVQGAKSFVSGATLGIAETALRQEVQILLNERENRDAVEYLIGGAAGGGFNTMFDVFSRTGKWGQAKAKQVTSRAKEALAKKADELEARAETVAPRARPKLRLEANRIRQSINLVDDLGQQLDTATEALNNPKPKEAPEASATTATPKDLDREYIEGNITFEELNASQKYRTFTDFGAEFTKAREANDIERFRRIEKLGTKDIAPPTEFFHGSPVKGMTEFSNEKLQAGSNFRKNGKGLYLTPTKKELSETRRGRW